MQGDQKTFCITRTPTLDTSSRLVVPGIDTNAKERKLQIFNPATRALFPGFASPNRCTLGEAGPIFTFLILVGRCLGHGDEIAGLLVLSTDRSHAIAVIIVGSVASAPCGLYEDG